MAKPKEYSKYIEPALEQLLADDEYLLEHNLAERAITHKLGEKLQALLPRHNVDCEYNRMISSSGSVVKNSINPQTIFNEICKQVATQIESIKKGMSNTDPHREDSGEISTLLDNLRDLERDFESIESDNYSIEKELIQFGIYIVRDAKPDKILRPTNIFPDIICHHRGTLNNCFVIEAKKTNNPNQKARHFDLLKLATLVKLQNYKSAYFIDIPVKGDLAKLSKFNISQFVDGRIPFFKKVWIVMPC